MAVKHKKNTSVTKVHSAKKRCPTKRKAVKKVVKRKATKKQAPLRRIIKVPANSTVVIEL